MKPAYCKLCGHEHWGLEHVWGKESRTVVSFQSSSDVTNRVTNQRELSGAAKRMAEWRVRHLEENRARQRELMRKRRAAARAGLPANLIRLDSEETT